VCGACLISRCVAHLEFSTHFLFSASTTLIARLLCSIAGVGVLTRLDGPGVHHKNLHMVSIIAAERSVAHVGQTIVASPFCAHNGQRLMVPTIFGNTTVVTTLGTP
jgi:hypothetical protein